MFGRLFFVVTMFLSNKSFAIGKHDYFPLKWCHNIKKYLFMGRAAKRSMKVASIKFFAISSLTNSFSLLLPLVWWESESGKSEEGYGSMVGLLAALSGT